jgi:hypothetical protein
MIDEKALAPWPHLHPRFYLIIALAAAGPASSNGSSSELAAGGIVLVETNAITMQRFEAALKD